MVKAAGKPQHLCPIANDLSRVAKVWKHIVEKGPENLISQVDLADQMDEILWYIPDDMPYREEMIKHAKVLKQLNNLERRSWNSVDDSQVDYQRASIRSVFA